MKCVHVYMYMCMCVRVYMYVCWYVRVYTVHVLVCEGVHVHVCEMYAYLYVYVVRACIQKYNIVCCYMLLTYTHI